MTKRRMKRRKVGTLTRLIQRLPPDARAELRRMLAWFGGAEPERLIAWWLALDDAHDLEADLADVLR